jgi:hypothetical protein
MRTWCDHQPVHARPRAGHPSSSEPSRLVGAVGFVCAVPAQLLVVGSRRRRLTPRVSASVIRTPVIVAGPLAGYRACSPLTSASRLWCSSRQAGPPYEVRPEARDRGIRVAAGDLELDMRWKDVGGCAAIHQAALHEALRGSSADAEIRLGISVPELHDNGRRRRCASPTARPATTSSSSARTASNGASDASLSASRLPATSDRQAGGSSRQASARSATGPSCWAGVAPSSPSRSATALCTATPTSTRETQPKLGWQNGASVRGLR